ncbi:hypothetical protein CWE08_09600 [Aliidiomarina iranensis]|uniref:Carboxypeptidase regulatory-like domain-containing protein n=1 Tax=Aliidiomarina iranensis TaxID=1434071 RepID=A0A432VTD4_9GAMM|nr:hypothetical protein [Aliidiomarina iranensis]RUO19674.1 hypothetical protein CWE08_09600 [Aliidiomarina iranensis]
MITTKLKHAALLAALSLALTGCFSGSPNPRTDGGGDGGGPTQPTDPVVVAPEQPEALAVVVNGNIVDAGTLNVLESATIAFREDGAASDSVATVNGEPVTQITVEEGSFSFTLRDGASPDVVRLLVTADGYFPKAFNIDFTSGEAEIESLLTLVAQAGDDVAVDSAEDDVADATTAAAITATADSANAGGEATVPAGTQLRDSAGNAVTGTSVTLNVGAINPQSNTSGSAIPDGLSSGVDGQVAVPVGVVDVTMRDNLGTNIKSFSNPINVSLRLPTTTLGPNGVDPIETGDEFQLSSFDEETGEWAIEDTNAVVGALNGAGTAYTASFETDHLTLFAAATNPAVCTSTFTLNLSGDVPGLYGLSLQSTSRGFTYYFNGTTVTLDQSFMSRWGIAANAEAEVSIIGPAGNAWGSSDGLVSICGNTLNLTLENPVASTVEEAVTVTAVCSNDDEVRTNIANAEVKYRETGSGSIRATARGVSGEAGSYQLVDLNADADSYTVSVNPRLEGVAPFTQTITPDGEDETIEFNITCPTVTGTGTGGG